MSRPVPRKNRSSQHPQQSQYRGHQRNRSSQHIQVETAIQTASDYESDSAYYMAQQQAPSNPALAQRTNTELNLGVLRRYLPSISQIFSIAANAVVYMWSTETNNWEKTGIEGTMFVCAQNDTGPSPSDTWEGKQGCIFILNRKNLENMVLPLVDVDHFECEGENQILTFKMEDGVGSYPGLDCGIDGGLGGKVLGLWLHSDEQATVSTNVQLIHEMWSTVRRARASV